MQFLRNSGWSPRVRNGMASRSSAPAALLTALAVAAAAGCSSAGTDSGGQASPDQQAAATVMVQALHDLGTGDYADLCTIVAPGSPMLAAGVDECATLAKTSMMSAGQQRGATEYLSKASEFTVEASKVVVTGDSGVVPIDAVLYQGQPVTPFEGMQDQRMIRKNGQWYVVY